MENNTIDGRNGWKYELVGDYYLPIGTRLEEADSDDDRPGKRTTATANETGAITADRRTIGRFGRAHEVYLKQTKRHVYSQLVAEGKLGPYLAKIDEQANDMLELLIGQLAAAEGVTEALKARDQMAWVGAMNNIGEAALEIVREEMRHIG